jgi:glyoxylase-like metal-dependent hydrolase (beta-lactamase superfamily II)
MSADRSRGRNTDIRSCRHVLSCAEWEHWNDKPDLGGPTQADIDVLTARVELVDGEDVVAPGITAVPTHGHTPGHLSFRVTSGDERALILGDAIHCPLQVSHPEWAFMADGAPDAARRAREQLLRELDEPEVTVVGPHFPDAVFGRVVTEPTGRRVAFDVAVLLHPNRLHPKPSRARRTTGTRLSRRSTAARYGLDGPAVAVRIAEVDERAPGEVLDVADVDAAEAR